MELELRRSPAHLAVLVVGSDAVIEALPARPIQLAHACGALGFDLVIPGSWGDELIAKAAMDVVSSRGSASAVLCACPVVRQRLLHHGSDLASRMISLASPPVAAARFLRSVLRERLASLSYVGRCPGGRHGDYDRVWEPSELFAFLQERGIDLEKQPDVFQDRIPPDRRRFYSLPGGCPAPDVLWHACNERILIELDVHETTIDLAQQLLLPGSALVDAAVAMGCSCSAVTHTTPGPAARIAAASLEPPRSTTPVIEAPADLELALPVSRDEGGVALSKVAGPARTPRRTPAAVTPPGALTVRKWPA